MRSKGSAVSTPIRAPSSKYSGAVWDWRSLCSDFGSRLQFLQRGVHAIARQHYSTIGTVNLAYQMSVYRQLKYHRILRTPDLYISQILPTLFTSILVICVCGPTPPRSEGMLVQHDPRKFNQKAQLPRILHQCVVKITSTATMAQKSATFAIFQPIDVKIFRFKTAHMLHKHKRVRGQHEQ